MSIDFDGAAGRLHGHLGKAPPIPGDMVVVESMDLAMILMERRALLTTNGLLVEGNTGRQDKIEGLESDLFLAVETAYKRGAVEWTRLNYPAYYERLSGGAGQ